MAPQKKVTLPSEGQATVPTIGIVSLGCPKALVDSERIITRLRAEGYVLSADYVGADAWWSTPAAFSTAPKRNRWKPSAKRLLRMPRDRHRVLGCGGRPHSRSIPGRSGRNRSSTIRGGGGGGARGRAERPHPFLDLVPPQGVRLTPRHYAYLKISEGCNHACSFCIIPHLRGPLRSRPFATSCARPSAGSPPACRRFL